MLLREPWTCVLAVSRRADERIGKFCSRFAPGSGSPGSFGVTPAGPRSIPRLPLNEIVLPSTAFPVPDSTETPRPTLNAITFFVPAAVPPITFPFAPA